MLILSTFSNLIDFFGRGFHESGYCVVMAGDIVAGQDIRDFTPPSLVFDGVIGGPPCPAFSAALRQFGVPDDVAAYGHEMLNEYKRCVLAAQPKWWLMENVPSVPDVTVPGYTHQRLDVNSLHFGLKQNRLRHFQFGSRMDQNRVLILDRPIDDNPRGDATCIATEAERGGARPFAEFCNLQGLNASFSLDKRIFKKSGMYRLVGNGVSVPVARALAEAIRIMPRIGDTPACICGCGRIVTTRKHAGAACRKRMQRRRDSAKIQRD